VDTTTTDAEGNYALVGYGAGQYVVVQQPPAGWEQVAPNYGNPVFTLTTPTVAGPTPPIYTNNSSMATADFNSDGRMDLVVGSLQPTGGPYSILSVSVMYNQPDGSFKTEPLPPFIAFNNSVPLVTVGDFNGDHRPDLAVVHSGLLDGGGRTGTYVYVYLNTGNPADPFNNFQNPIKLQPGDADGQYNYYSAIASGDINGDGSDELVLGLSRPAGQDGNWVYVANIATTPTYEMHKTGYAGTSVINKVAIEDVDGNGFKDVVVAAEVPYPRSLNSLPELLGSSVVEVGTRGDATHWAYAADYLQGDGPTTGLAVGSVQPGELPNWYTVAPKWLYADVNLDGPPTSGGNIPSYQAGINTGSAVNPFTAARGVWNNSEARPKDQTYNFHLVSGLRLEDMNGDGLPDLVYLYAPTPSTQAIAIRINNGDGFDLTAPPSILIPLPSNLTDFVGDFEVADFNGDGLNDIFVAGVGQSPGMLFLNGTPQNKPGNSLFAAAGSWQTGLDFQSLQVEAKSAVRGQVFEDVLGRHPEHRRQGDGRSGRVRRPEPERAAGPRRAAGHDHRDRRLHPARTGRRHLLGRNPAERRLEGDHDGRGVHRGNHRQRLGGAGRLRPDSTADRGRALADRRSRWVARRDRPADRRSGRPSAAVLAGGERSRRDDHQPGDRGTDVDSDGRGRR
jgi:hypothetical protein